MSVLLLAHRRKACQKKKKIFRKVGHLDKSGEPKITHEWITKIDGKPTKIGFSRDIMYAFVNDVHVGCTAYITDKDFDLDLKFDIGCVHVHIYSDVEGDEMTNYLFVDDKMECCETKKLSE